MKGLTGATAYILTLFMTLGLLMAASPSARAQDITSGLVGHWKFDETSGTTLANEVGTDATLTMDAATATAAGKVGTALTFNGTSDYGSVNDAALNIAGSMTIAAWVKPSTFGTDVGGGLRVSSVLDRQLIGDGYSLGLYYNGSSHLVAYSNSNGNVLSDAGILALNIWQHIAAVFDGGTVTFYVNGDASGSAGFPLNASGASVAYIGVDTGVSEFFDGNIDELRVYNRALTEADIAELYATHSGNLRYNADYRVPEYHDGTQWVAAGPQKYVPNAVAFDGASTFLEHNGFALPQNSKTITGSMWFKKDVIGIEYRPYESGASDHTVFLGADGSVTFAAYNSSAAYILICGTTGTPANDTNWHHLMWSFDLSDPTKKHIYVDEIDQTPATCATYVDDVFLQPANARVGRASSGTYYQGALADFWYESDTYIDLSIEANRRKFIDASGAPVYLGTDGSAPTGTAPEIFLSGDTADWHTNKGTGGGFTENGALGDGGRIGDTPGDVTDSLVAHWDLDESSGNLTDNVGARQLTVGNGTPAYNQAGKISSAIGLDGTDDLFEGSADWNDLDMQENMSVAIWVYFDALSNGQGDEMVLVQKAHVGAPWHSWMLWKTSDDKLQFQISDAAGAHSNAEYTGSLNPDQWYHVVGVKSGQDVQLYINASQQNTTPAAYTSELFDASNVVILGSDWSAGYLNGRLDDFRFYNRALSLGEITELYNGRGLCTQPDHDMGTIVYNGTANVLQYCDGANWQAMGPVPGAGGGGCSNPAGSAGSAVFNGDYSVMQYCDGANWIAIGKPPRPQCPASPSSGDEGCAMPDGTIYAGLSPDGNLAMYTTAADEGGFPWNNGNSSGVVNTSIASCTGAEASCRTGEANTATLVSTDADSSVGGTQPHQAAQVCADLNVHGYDDWYLPAKDELNVLYQHKTAIGEFDISGSFPESYYWSSSEGTSGCAQLFSNGSGSCAYNKTSLRSVRCVRR